MNIQDIVRKAVELDASDIFFVAGSPIAFKIKNNVTRIENEVLSPDHCHMVVDELYRLAGNRNKDHLEHRGDDDFSFSFAHLARLRVNVYHQRNSLAAVIRLVKFDIPTASDLSIPTEITSFSELKNGL